VTVGDLVTFAQAVRAGQLLTLELTELFLTPQVLHHDGDGWAVWYGFGLEFVRNRGGVVRIYYKDGVNTGASGIARYYPDPQLDVVVLANSSVGPWMPSTQCITSSRQTIQ
jgi:CubicO group peptidase (beta-lactamase class C family)